MCFHQFQNRVTLPAHGPTHPKLTANKGLVVAQGAFSRGMLWVPLVAFLVPRAPRGQGCGFHQDMTT